MCRLLLVRSGMSFQPQKYLEEFAEICRNSKEFQGHGWGCSYLDENIWKHYRNISPVWEDDLKQFADTALLVAHARSAFRDEGIEVENNMPFYDDNYVFIFNGELRGVRLNSTGRTGAEKIFNFIKRFDKGVTEDAIRRAAGVIRKRTAYIRAMNFIIAKGTDVYVYSHFNEDSEYFTMKYSDEDSLIVCSETLPCQTRPKEFPNDTLMHFK